MKQNRNRNNQRARNRMMSVTKAKTFEISDSKSLALTSTDSQTLTDIGEDCTDVAKYDKLSIFLEGRVEELQRITEQMLKENEAAAKEEHVQVADHNENMDGTTGETVSLPDRKRQKREIVADILGTREKETT
ncbi:hypothetical protein RJT34_17704 [Clitoria ternatea]|uniref:Uncharacterized protein n=1 Tax=Clitoria ternatea TaxID=43366 RepID=A0AAN9J9G0_CLITE